MASLRTNISNALTAVTSSPETPSLTNPAAPDASSTQHPPHKPVHPKQGESPRNEASLATARAFRFDPASPPSLSQLAAWLGLDSAVDAAMLLNSYAIQSSFTAYRARRGRPSVAAHPERLGLAVPLFTFPRDSLLLFRARFERRGGGSDGAEAEAEEMDGIAFGAALFANHAIRYIERSAVDVPWGPLADHMDGFADFETARWRWAVVLQMYWFLEKAFVRVPGEVSS